MVDKITHPLELIIGSAPYILVCIADDTHHPLCSLSLVKMECKSISETFDSRFALEGRQTGIQQQSHCTNELFRVWTYCKKCFDGEMLKETVSLGSTATHKDNHLVIELKGVRFKFYTLCSAISIPLPDTASVTYSGT